MACERERRVEREDDGPFSVARVAERLPVPVGDAEREDAGGVCGKIRVLVLLWVVSARQLPAHSKQVRDELFAAPVVQARTPLSQPVAHDLSDQSFGVFDPARPLA